MLSWCCLQVAVANTSTVFASDFLAYCGLRFLSAFGLAGIILATATLCESLAHSARLLPRGGGEGGIQDPDFLALPCSPLHGLSVVEWTTTYRRDFTLTLLGCVYSTGQMALGGLAFALRDWRALQLAVSTPFFAVFLISWSVQCGAFTLGENATEWEGDPGWAGTPHPHHPGWPRAP